MGLFFFHFTTESERDEDATGVELPSAEAAYLTAVETAFGMAGELLADGIDASRCGFEITDTHGELLMVLDFAELLKRDGRAPQYNRHTSRLAGVIEDTHRRASVAKQELSASLARTRANLDESRQLIARLNSYERRGTICTSS